MLTSSFNILTCGVCFVNKANEETEIVILLKKRIPVSYSKIFLQYTVKKVKIDCQRFETFFLRGNERFL